MQSKGSVGRPQSRNQVRRGRNQTESRWVRESFMREDRSRVELKRCGRPGQDCVSYPVALSGLDRLLTGRRAGTHAVCILTVGGMPVTLVLVLPSQCVTCFPGESKGTRPAGRGCGNGAPERGGAAARLWPRTAGWDRVFESWCG